MLVLQKSKQIIDQPTTLDFQTISSETSAVGYDVIISPFTVWSLLLMTAEGAGGNTLEQLKRVLNVDNLDVRSEYKDVQAALRYTQLKKSSALR